jgi:uncharacterized repeat protein (TIGR02543 family)
MMKYKKGIGLALCLILVISMFQYGALAATGLPIDPGGGGGYVAALTVSYDANGAESGTVPGTVGYTAGATVTVAGNTGILSKKGYVFGGWNTKADGTGNAYFSGSAFTMPSESAVLYAHWVGKVVRYDRAQWPQSDKNYNVAFSASDGNKTIVPTSYYYQPGGVILYKTPVAGSYGAKYNFVGFDDITGDYWASEYILFLSARTVVNGVGGNLYAPEQNVTRAAFVKMLAGITPGVDLSNIPAAGFTDVPSTEWYAPYVNWAAANSIAAGYDGKFSPNDPITREQMCKMIAAYVAYIRYDLGSLNPPAAFTDEDSISSWALDSVKALQRSGLITGSDNQFNPKGLSTRATAATVVCRLLMGVLSALDNPSVIPVS